MLKYSYTIFNSSMLFSKNYKTFKQIYGLYGFSKIKRLDQFTCVYKSNKSQLNLFKSLSYFSLSSTKKLTNLNTPQNALPIFVKANQNFFALKTKTNPLRLIRYLKNYLFHKSLVILKEFYKILILMNTKFLF
jgi:hypothetical protein